MKKAGRLYDYRRFGYLAITLTATSVLLYICIREIDLRLFWANLRRDNLAYILPGICATFMILMLNTIQFRIFLHTSVVSFKRLFEHIAVFTMMTHLLPFWGGHALLIYLLGHREQIGKTRTLSAITLDQIVEGLAKLLVFAPAALIAPFPGWMAGGIQSFVLIILGAYVVMVFWAVRYRNLNRQDDPRATGWKRAFSVFIRWAYHLHVLRSIPRMICTVFLAVLMKACECIAVFWVQRSFGAGLGFDAAVLMVAALSLTTAIPLTPGRLGLFEGTAMALYQFLGLDPTTAFTLGVFIHIVYITPSLMVGYIAMAHMGLKRRVLISYPQGPPSDHFQNSALRASDS